MLRSFVFNRRFLRVDWSISVLQRTVHLTPDFTKNNCKVRRGYYNNVQSTHINFFRKLLGENRLVTDPTDLEKHNVDFFKKYRGSSAVVLKPRTTDEVSQIVRFCDNNRLAVCPQGGNTGVVGGSIPVFDEIIISTELMNEILFLDETSGVLVCQSGCILSNLDDYLAERGFMVPLDLGAKGSCHIGGNVSTNAGGLRLLRYGNLHGNVLGVEVVQANGEVLDCMSTLKKDNTGFHLKHLFIGSEGTLGIVTKVALQCPPRPKSVNVAFLGFQSYEKVLETFKHARQVLGEIISAAEVMDLETMKFAAELNLKSPIGEYPFYLLIETSGSDEGHDSEKLHNFLQSGLEKGLILNGTVASDAAKVKALWDVREKVPQGFPTRNCLLTYDFSMPLRHYYQIVDETRENVRDRALRVFGFGHLGDCNLHLQIDMKEYDKDVVGDMEAHLFESVMKYKGSISAEHGMGMAKGKYLSDVKSGEYVQLMRTVKSMLDPNKILNPYKMFS